MWVCVYIGSDFPDRQFRNFPCNSIMNNPLRYSFKGEGKNNKNTKQGERYTMLNIYPNIPNSLVEHKGEPFKYCMYCVHRRFFFKSFSNICWHMVLYFVCSVWIFIFSVVIYTLLCKSLRVGFWLITRNEEKKSSVKRVHNSVAFEI